MMIGMKSSVFFIGALAVCLALCLGSCKNNPAPQNEVEKLPELPSELASTLDPDTMATRTPAANPAPTKSPTVILAPCCSSTETKTLQVKFTYTKCVFPQLELLTLSSGPSVSDPAKNQGTRAVRSFKLTSLNGKRLLDLRFCTTSEGPWNATFIEERKCSPITPQDTLVINAFDDQIIFQWTGGTENHPASVSLVSCKEIGTTRFNCGISTCDCTGSACQPNQACPCTLQGW
jgi:hypothetical protein